MDIRNVLEAADSDHKKKYVNEVSMEGVNSRVVRFIKHTAGVLRAPTNFVFGEITTLLGAMLGRKVIVIDGARMNRCNLFSGIVGVASGGKTPSINYSMKPLNAMEKDRYDNYSRARHAAKQKGEDLPIYSSQLVVSNETIENLYRVLDNVKSQNSGLLMHQDELLNFFGSNAKKYSDGNIISDFLTLFDAFTPLRVGRVSLEQQIFVPDPFVSILGGIQKKRIDELFQGQEHNGFFSRWQFWLPNEDSTLIEEPDDLADQQWADLLERAVSQDFGQIELHFEDEKQIRKYDDEYRIIRDKLEEHNEDDLSETIMKQSYIIRRLAAIFHCMNALAEGYRPNEIIRQETVEYASKVVEHLFFSSCVIERVIASKRQEKITGRQAILALDANYGIKNQSMLSAALGGSPSQQYIAKILNKNQNTTK